MLPGEAHIPDKDIVLPPLISHKVFFDLKLKRSPLHPSATNLPTRRRRLFFSADSGCWHSLLLQRPAERSVGQIQGQYTAFTI
eukprot:gene28892-32084_t